MSPLVTFYILAGIVGLAVLVFIVMIVVTALRPPPLPDLRIDSPPLERMIRALTPLPFATTVQVSGTRPTPTPRSMPASVAVPPPPPPPAAARSAAVAAPPPRPPVVAPPAAPVLPPRPAPVVAPPVRPNVVAVSSPTTFDRSREFRRPVYPQRRSRVLVRILVGMFVMVTLAAGTIVAFPSVIDPLCDDYEWFGAEAASVVRHYACDAHNAIYELVEDL